MNLSMRNFIAFRNLVYDRSGIHFESKKIYFIKKRLATRLEALGLKDPAEYIHHLKFRDPKGDEFQKLLNLLTTNETYMFREFDQLATFGEECLAEVCEHKKANKDNTMKIWCAGCSTGEEAYTLAIILLEMLEPFDAWRSKIEATDIDTSVLAKAKKAIYSPRSVKDVPDEYLKAYLQQSGENYKVNTLVKELVSFKRINLMDKKQLSSVGMFDFIFCRNVLIYFDENSRKEVIHQFYEHLNPGGFIFLGHSESIGRISTSFKLRKMGGMIVYQKG